MQARSMLAKIGALLLAFGLWAGEAAAQSGGGSVRPPPGAVINAPPGGADPTGRAAGPLEPMWGEIRKGVQGQVSIPDKKAGTLVQSSGEAWRNFRNGPLVIYGAYAMGSMLGLLALFYLVRGKIQIEAGWSGRTIERFGEFERFGHWLMAVSFIVLGLTGLNVLYGRNVLLPIIGKDAFATVSQFGKWLHNYVAFAFMLGLLISFVMWIRHNIPTGTDVKWLARGGGMFSKHSHPPARKFNAGQKILFWLIMLGGISISMSGLSLMFPFQTSMFAKTFGFMNIFGLGLPANPTPIQEMQFAAAWHAIMGLFLICVIFAHIYIGTVGMQGAFAAMGSGRVDVNWAKEHHSIWADEEIAKANERGEAVAPPAGRVQPAE